MGVAGTNTYPRCSHCGQLRTGPSDVLRCPHCGRKGRRLLNGYCDECVEKRVSGGTHLKEVRKCLVQDCTNYTDEGRFVGDVCSPCWSFMVTGKANSSQACRNVLHVVSKLLGKKAMESVEKFVSDAIYVTASATDPAQVQLEDSPDPVRFLAPSMGDLDVSLSTRVDDLELSVRATNALVMGYGDVRPINTLGELVQHTERELLKRRGMGLRSVREIEEALARVGLSLRKGS